MFCDVAASSGPQAALGVHGLVVHRQDQGRDLRVARLHVLDQVQAITPAELEIDDHQVGLALADGLQRGLVRGGFATHREVGLGLDQGGQPATQRRVIIDDKNPLPGRRRPCSGVIALMVRLLADVGSPWEGEGAGDYRTAPGTPSYLEASTDQARTVGHRVQADAAGVAGRLRNAHTIVPDRQDALPFRPSQAYLDLIRSSVGHGVVYGFLCNAV